MWAGRSGAPSRPGFPRSTTTSRATTPVAGSGRWRCSIQIVCAAGWPRRNLTPLDDDHRDVVGGAVDAIRGVLQMAVQLPWPENQAHLEPAVEQPADPLVVSAVHTR